METESSNSRFIKVCPDVSTARHMTVHWLSGGGGGSMVSRAGSMTKLHYNTDRETHCGDRETSYGDRETPADTGTERNLLQRLTRGVSQSRRDRDGSSPIGRLAAGFNGLTDGALSENSSYVDSVSYQLLCKWNESVLYHYQEMPKLSVLN